MTTTDDEPGRTGGPRTRPASADEPPWMRRQGYLRQVTGYRQAAALLSDARLHADMIGMLEAVGLRPGTTWDYVAASMLSTDGETHRRLRSVVAPRFTPRAVEAVRDACRAAADDAAERLTEGTEADLMATFALPFVSVGTCRFLGIGPDELEPLLVPLEVLGEASGDLHHRLGEWEAAGLQLTDFARRALDERRGGVGDDLLTEIARCVDRGELSDVAAESMIAGFLSAGHEPTVKQIGLMVQTLAEHPDVWDAIGRGDLEVPRAVEELLRFRSTNQGAVRRVSEEVELDGACLRQDETLVVAIAEANGDPERFPAADRFDPDVNTASHLAFGIGPHHCLGAALARVQLQEALRALTSTLECPRVLEVTSAEGAGLAGPRRLVISCRGR